MSESSDSSEEKRIYDKLFRFLKPTERPFTDEEKKELEEKLGAKKGFFNNYEKMLMSQPSMVGKTFPPKPSFSWKRWIIPIAILVTYFIQYVVIPYLLQQPSEPSWEINY
jgi:hypothetical protein